MTGQLIWGGLWILLAGAAGSIIPTALVEHMSRNQRLVYIGIGMMTAVFISPGIDEYVFPNAGLYFRGAIAFLTGLIGLKLAEILIRLFERRGEAFLDGVASRVLGEKNRGDDDANMDGSGQ